MKTWLELRDLMSKRFIRKHRETVHTNLQILFKSNSGSVKPTLLSNHILPKLPKLEPDYYITLLHVQERTTITSCYMFKSNMIISTN